MAFKDNYDSGETELKSTASQDSPIHCSVDENHPYGDGLPPVDGGRHAWLFLLASAMLEALVWGRYPFIIKFGIELTVF
jgi:hypothetical protein